MSPLYFDPNNVQNGTSLRLTKHSFLSNTLSPGLYILLGIVYEQSSFF